MRARRDWSSLALTAALAGLSLLLGGLAWDARLHAHPDPSAAEGLVTLRNPAHVVMAVGLALTGAALFAAVVGQLRRGRPWSAAHRLQAGAAVAAALTSIASTAIVVSAEAPLGPTAGARRAAKQQRAFGHPTGDEPRPGHPASAALGVAARGHHSGRCDRPPTASQRAAAARLVALTKRETAGYRRLGSALGDGYRAVTQPSLPVVHYLKDRYLRDGAILDPARPEALVYAGASGESRLLAAMYVMPRAGIAGPCIGGSLTRWHAHTNLCFDRSTRAVVGSVGPHRSCPPGAVNRVTPEMLHVWVVPNPGGPFASVTDPPARSRR